MAVNGVGAPSGFANPMVGGYVMSQRAGANLQIWMDRRKIFYLVLDCLYDCIGCHATRDEQAARQPCWGLQIQKGDFGDVSLAPPPSKNIKRVYQSRELWRAVQSKGIWSAFTFIAFHFFSELVLHTAILPGSLSLWESKASNVFLHQSLLGTCLLFHFVRSSSKSPVSKNESAIWAQFPMVLYVDFWDNALWAIFYELGAF